MSGTQADIGFAAIGLRALSQARLSLSGNDIAYTPKSITRNCIPEPELQLGFKSEMRYTGLRKE
eukprot:3931809-Rhodomonas_salina.1